MAHRYYVKFSGGESLDTTEKVDAFVDVCSSVGKVHTIRAHGNMEYGFINYKNNEDISSITEKLNELRPFNMKFVKRLIIQPKSNDAPQSAACSSHYFEDDDNKSRHISENEESDGADCTETVRYDATGEPLHILHNEDEMFITMNDLHKFGIELHTKPIRTFTPTQYRNEMEAHFRRYMYQQTIGFIARNKIVVFE